MTGIPSCEPTHLTAGLTWQWRRSLPDYPATEGWTASYLFSGPSGGFELLADAADGADHLVSMNAAATASRPAGTYLVVGIARKGDDAFRFFSGSITLASLPSSDATTTADERILAALIAGIEGRLVGTPLEECTVNGRHVKFLPLGEMETLRRMYEARVAAARASAAGGGNPFGRQMAVTFRG